MRKSKLYGRAGMLFLGLAIGALIGASGVANEMIFLLLLFMFGCLALSFYFLDKEATMIWREEKQDRDHNLFHHY